MNAVSPPKPWEQSGPRAAGVSGPASPPVKPALPAGAPNGTTAPAAAAAPAVANQPPALPDRPAAMTAPAMSGAMVGTAPGMGGMTGMSTVSPYNSMSMNRFGTSPYGIGGYGGYGGYNSYSSPYSRFGGGYGSMYGGMYGGGMGMGMDPNGNSLTQTFGQSTQATFQLIEGLVGAVGGFAQMLESTYMATHSSFFAMVSVAEQFGNLRRTLGSVLGIFTLIRWVRNFVAKITGRPPPASSEELNASQFAAFSGMNADGSAAPQMSKKPLVMFALAVFGLPYLMKKLITSLAQSQEQQQQQQQQQLAGPVEMVDPTKLEFCRLLYDYPGEAGGQVSEDLSVKKGDLVAVLSKTDPAGNASQWWKCRARDGRVGYLPGPYLEAIQRRE